MIIYNDRVFCFEKMKSLFPSLFDTPDNETIHDFIEAEVRNRMGFLELDSFNRHGTFIFIHPLLQQYKFRLDMEALPGSELANKLNNIKKNLSRYKRKIDNAKTAEEKDIWQEKYKEYKEYEKVIRDVLNE